MQAECENSTENRYIVIENPVVQFCPAGFLLAIMGCSRRVYPVVLFHRDFSRRF
ncbi:hypothetical protein GCWU000342_00207 [Shuttleworthella satelles DSM 14600]|uniref:Uncharacterized protein n=1 Tax=Shuttleworthella satelles DSM 14600 TaxID=626523 RepID=C4G831_9FIRM|nr:hypothetical protein GCWU000342_00207 [Shuttleworthia satelles DSM 14600]